MKKMLTLICLCTLLFGSGFAMPIHTSSSPAPKTEIEEAVPKKFIRWVDFKVPYGVLKTAYDLELKANKAELGFPLIKSLAYITSKNGNNFKTERDKKALYKLYNDVKNGTTIDALGSANKY